MRILNLNGRYFVGALQRMGHRVLTLDVAPGCDVLLEHPLSFQGLQDILDARGFRPDLVLWCDTCKVPSVIGFEALPVPTIGYSIDQYCNPWHIPYAWAFDHMSAAQKDYLPMFRAERTDDTVEWFPLFCNPERDKDLSLERDIPVSFVGTVDGTVNRVRKEFLEAFKRRAPLLIKQGDYVPIFNRSRIVLNQSAAGELNFRIFQAAACGAAVLTEETGNGLHELFTPDTDIFVYPKDDAAAAVQKVVSLLNNPQSLHEVASHGRKKVRTEHSVTARAKRILTVAEDLIRSEAHTHRLENIERVQTEIRKAFAMLAFDEELPLPPEQRRFYAELGAGLHQ